MKTNIFSTKSATILIATILLTLCTLFFTATCSLKFRAAHRAPATHQKPTHHQSRQQPAPKPPSTFRAPLVPIAALTGAAYGLSAQSPGSLQPPQTTSSTSTPPTLDALVEDAHSSLSTTITPSDSFPESPSTPPSTKPPTLQANSVQVTSPQISPETEKQSHEPFTPWPSSTQSSRQYPASIPIWKDDDAIEPVVTSTQTAGVASRVDDNPMSFEQSQQNQTATSTTTSSAVTANRSHADLHPMLIYSMRFEIRCFDLSNLSSRSPISQSSSNLVSVNSQQTDQHSHSASRHSKTLIGGLKNTIGLDFYYSEHESFIFWTDVIEERIYRGTILDGTITNVDIVVQTGLATAEGLAIDWIGRNIYWVESTLDHIEISNMNGTFRRTLIAGDMESPRAIAVDPRHGLLFWTDWDKKVPRIERATMSGDDRKTLVHIKEVNGGWPNGLTLDYDSLKIYWIDANSDSIHMVDYEGNDHHSVLRNIKSLGHPFSITLFENNLYWTDWKTNSVSMANKHNGSDARELQRLSNRLFDIKVFHPSRQPKIDNSLNPCYINNGNCSHLCLLSVNHTRRCECPNLMRLSKDSKTCETYENVLLIGRTNEIRAVDISEPLHHIMAPISVPKVFNPRQFEFDAKSRTIFWVDFQTNEVKRAQLTGNNIETIIDVIIDSPSGLAFDWISGNIYVTSASHQKSSGKIYISNLNGEYISILMDSSQDIVSPKSLAVHPVLGLLFYVDENSNLEPVIYAAGMDGKHRRMIASKINDPKLDNPASLAMDFELNRVYWINQAVNSPENTSIQYYDILEDRIVTILDESELKPNQRINPGVLCVDGDYLIISGRHPNEAIMRASKYNLTERTVYKTHNMDQISALRVFNASSQVGSNACSLNNGNCSQLCVPANSTHRTCKCTLGYSSNPFNETECVGKDLFLIFSYNLGMKGIGIDPRPANSPEEHYLPPIHKAFRASSINYVHRDNLIYWVDNEEGSITRINSDTTNYQVIVQGLESEESIAVDWVAGNIYWLDPYYDIIEVARLNGSSRYVIVSGDMDKANGIVVNPIKGYIVWSDTGSFPKIETANLDGSNRKIIVSKNLSHVDDLAIDYLDDYIYWVDSTQAIIERVKEDGSERQVIYSSDINQGLHNHLVSIAIHKDYLFIADSVQYHGSIIRCDKNNTSNKQIIQQSLGDGIRDIVVYAEQPLPGPDENPCVKNNGGCQDLCLFMGKFGKKRCICSHGRLKSDGLSCEPYDTFILYSKLSQIESLHIKDDESFNNSPYPPIAIENRSSIISLTVDYNAHRVIYSEITRDQICSVFFNGTDRRVIVERQSLVEGIAFSNDQLYWTSIHDNSISRLNTTSAGQLKTSCASSDPSCKQIEKIVRLSSDDKPRGIVFDSCTNYVYWTNWNTNASIQRAAPHTGYKVESIIKTNIKVPNGIAIDQKQRRLYWCDARLDKIETCEMDGSNRIILVSASPQHPFALAIWENNVYWTDWLARGVFRADKYTGKELTQIKKVAQRPMGIAVAAPEAFECPMDKCAINNGGCAADEVCRMHLTLDGDRVDCNPRDMLVDLRPVHMFQPAQAPVKTYHDIIMDSLDRYNLSDYVTIQPLPGSKHLESTTEDAHHFMGSTSPLTPRKSLDSSTFPPQSPGSVSEQTTSSTRAAADNTTQVYKIPDIVQNIKFNRSSVSFPQNSVNLNSSSQAKTSSSSPNSSSINPTVIPTISTSTKRDALPELHTSNETSSQQPTQPTSSSAIPTYVITSSSTPSTAATQIPLTSSTPATPLPGQIVPAALQTTTEGSGSNVCDSASEFRCYLSEKAVCIPKEKKCDGNHDCPSKEDENDCYFSTKGSYNLKRETNWHRFVTVILVILGAAVTALFLVFGTRGKRRWFINTGSGFSHRRMFDDNGTNIEISNPMFDEDDSGNRVHCAFSIDLNERTTNFSNPLYERQVLLMNDKHVTSN